AADRLKEQGGVQSHQLAVKLERRPVVAFQTGIRKLSTQPRSHVGGDRDAAVPAMRHEAERTGILARELVEALPHRGTLLRDAHDVRGRILYAGNVLEFE